MKCTRISTGSSNDDKLTPEEFPSSEPAKTPLGELLIALIEETAWSKEYTIYASFGHDKPFLQVHHNSFLPGCSLMIYDDGKMVLSVRGVEDALRELFAISKKNLDDAIKSLDALSTNLSRESDQIMWDKARAAITATFPEAGNIFPYRTGMERDLYAFAVPGTAEGPLFVARAIGGDFVGGVVQVFRRLYDWYCASNGIEKGQRHRIFWEELAQVFAAQQLRVPEGCLYVEQFFAEKNPHSQTMPLGEEYNVQKVAFRYPSDIPTDIRDETLVVVEFGPGNLPVKTFIR